MARKVRVASGRVPFTWRKLVTAGALAACAPAVAAYAFQSAGPDRIEWSISPNGSHIDAGKVQRVAADQLVHLRLSGYEPRYSN